jgi:hypothetical protein
MGRKLSMMTWNDVQKEMSIAGEPERAVEFGREVYELALLSMDTYNIPSVDNQIFALERVMAGLIAWKKILQARQRIN